MAASNDRANQERLASGSGTDSGGSSAHEPTEGKAAVTPTHELAGLATQSEPATPPGEETVSRFKAHLATPSTAAGTTEASPERLPQLPGYEMLGILGHGGMGIVYQARHLKLNRIVALKMILAGGYVNRQERARFLIEAKAVAAVQHGNIVGVFDFGEHDGQPYMALEYINGGSLKGRLRESLPAPREAAGLVEQLAHGMQAAHDRGIIHRDLKPGNILLAVASDQWPVARKDGSSSLATEHWPLTAIPKITDFGLAKHLTTEFLAEGLTQPGAFMGTPSYVAPEQAAGRLDQIGPHTDVYALGTILYELLTGRPPFKGATMADTLDQVRHQEPVSPRQLQPKLPRDLETVCLKCLHKEPSRRYGSAAMLADDLRRFRAGEPIQARPVGGGERLWRWAKRKPALAGMSALAILATIVALVTLTVGFLLVSDSWDDALKAQDKAVKLASEKDNLAQKESAARNLAEQRRRQAQRDAADFVFQQAYEKCMNDDVAHGLLLLGRSLQEATKAEAEDLEWSIRMHLAAWSREVHPLKLVMEDSDEALRGYEARINTAAVSPDGRLIAAITGDMTVRLWETATGKRCGQALGHQYRLHGVLFSPDSKTVATFGEDHAVHLWDTATGTAVGMPLQHEGRIRQLVFSPDGKRLFVASDWHNEWEAWPIGWEGRLWDVQTSKRIGTPWQQGLGHCYTLAIAFSPDGKAILAGCGGSKEVKNKKGFKERKEWGLAQLWEAATGKPIGPALDFQGPVKNVAFSPDGETILTATRNDRLFDDSGEVRLWERATLKPVGPAMPHQSGLSIVTFSPNGKLILTGGARRVPFGISSRNAGEVRFWNGAVPWNAGKPIGPALEVKEPVRAAVFSSDGTTFLTAGHSTAQLWHTQSRKPLGLPLTHRELAGTQGITAVAFGPGGKTIVTGTTSTWASNDDYGGTGAGRVWELATFKAAGPALPHDADIGGIVWNPEGSRITTRTLASPGVNRERGKARLWDAATGRLLAGPLPRFDALKRIVFSPDGKTILTLSMGWTSAQLWDADTGKPIGEGLIHRGENEASYAVFSPDSKMLITRSGERTAQLWDVATAKPRGEALDLPGPLKGVGFSPDGSLIFTQNDIKDGNYVTEHQVRLWETATGKPIGQPLSHPDNVWRVAFSPDATLVLTGCNGKRILDEKGKFKGISGQARLWQAKTGKPLTPALEHDAQVTHVQFSPDAKTFVTKAGKKVQVWDTQTGKPHDPAMAHEFYIDHLAMSPDGKTIVTVTDTVLFSLSQSKAQVRLWDAGSGKLLAALPLSTGRLFAVAFSPDSKRIVTGSMDPRRPGQIWDAATGNPIGPPLKHDNTVIDVAFSPDGKTVVTGSYDGTVKRWEAATGKAIGSPLGHQNHVGAVRFSSDGRLILTKTFLESQFFDVAVHCWDAQTGKLLGTPLPHLGWQWSLALSPDGKRVLMSSQNGTLRPWDIALDRAAGPAFAAPDPIRTASFSPDGKVLLTIAKGAPVKKPKTTELPTQVRLWDVKTGKPIGVAIQHKGIVKAVAASRDGKTILTGSGRFFTGPDPAPSEARLWDVVSGKPIGLVMRHQGNINAVAISPDGKMLLTGSDDKTAQRWHAATGKPIRPTLQHKGRLEAVAFSPDGKTIITGASSVYFREVGGAQLWDAQTGKAIGPMLGDQGSVHLVGFTPDGKVAYTAGSDKTVRLWDAATGKPLGGAFQHRGRVNVVVFSPDGKTMMTGSGSANVAAEGRLWEVTTGKLIGRPIPHGRLVYAAAFTPDGKTALTVSEDQTMRLWDAATGKPVAAPVRLTSGIHRALAVATVPGTGGILIVTRHDQGARLLDAVSGKQVGPVLHHEGELQKGLVTTGARFLLTVSREKIDTSRIGEAYQPEGARIWNVTTGKPMGAPLAHPTSIKVFALSPDGATLLTETADQFPLNEPPQASKAQLWNVVTGKPIGSPLGPQKCVLAAAFSPDGKMVLTGSYDKTARLWDATTGKPLGQPLTHRAPVNLTGFSRDGNVFLTSDQSGVVQLWDSRTLMPLGPPMPHDGQVTSAAFLGESKIIVTASGDGARFWEAKTGKALGNPLIHQGKVSTLLLSPEGNRVLAASGDNTARIWQVPHLIQGDVDRVVLWIQVLTMMELDEHAKPRPLDRKTWSKRRQRLKSLGGPQPDRERSD